MAGGIPLNASRYYFKGSKAKMEAGDIATIIDLDAQTVTTLNNKQKTIVVKTFSDPGSAVGQGDMAVKETGQTKTISGYNAKELIMALDLAGPGTRRIESHIWVSADVPGASELHNFYTRNMDQVPSLVLGGQFLKMQAKVAEMNCVPVLEFQKFPMTAAQRTQSTVEIDSKDFSTSSIPDSVFAIPAGYEKIGQR